MTHPMPASARPAPGRGWYVVAAIIAIAAWTAMALFLVARLGGSAERMIRVVVPGEAGLRLNEPGTYTIFHEYRTTFEGRVYNVESVSGLEITVRSRVSGATLPLQRATSTSYTVGGRSGRSLFQFEAPAPGSYLIAGAYRDGRRAPQTILAIDRGFVGDLLLTIAGGLGMAFGGTALAIAVFALVFVRRRRQKRALAPR